MGKSLSHDHDSLNAVSVVYHMKFDRHMIGTYTALLYVNVISRKLKKGTRYNGLVCRQVANFSPSLS